MPPITINSVYPWGRSFSEYVDMFSLSPDDLRGSILDCGAGPASFCAEATAAGHRVTACDPLYRFSAQQIRERVEATWLQILDIVRTNYERFVWDRIRTPEQLGDLRLDAMRRFLEDFELESARPRYRAEAVPELSFTDSEFDLATVSHFLFLYSQQLSLSFHIAAVSELLRVAREVRLFPLLDFDGLLSSHVQPLSDHFTHMGHNVRIETVNYEFQRGGNQLLRITRA